MAGTGEILVYLQVCVDHHRVMGIEGVWRDSYGLSTTAAAAADQLLPMFGGYANWGGLC